jgi:hypothetical protein
MTTFRIPDHDFEFVLRTLIKMGCSEADGAIGSIGSSADRRVPSNRRLRVGCRHCRELAP